MKQLGIAQNWKQWWASLTPLERWAPFVLQMAYWLWLAYVHGLRVDHWSIGILVLALCYTGPAPRRVMIFLLPLLFTGMFYDSQRYWGDYVRGPVHVREPYDFDKYFFGIRTATGVLTPNEWFQLHTHPVIDVITGFFYFFFFAIFVAVAFYFHFWLTRKGTAKRSADWLRVRTPAVMYTFFCTNMLGYSTYYWFAAAPPWYVEKYGLGPAHLVPASAAGAVRFDQILGTHLFSEMYGRSADVFGAIPSLHVAYPFIAMWYAYRFGSLRVFCTIFYVIMCFSAVYLNHHYILDIMWGTAYSILMALVCERYVVKHAKT